MSQTHRVPLPDANAEVILRFFELRDGAITLGPCAQYHDEGGRCEGTLFVEDDSLTDGRSMVTLGCDTCSVVSFRTEEYILERARAKLADYHYNAQLDEGQQ